MRSTIEPHALSNEEIRPRSFLWRGLAHAVTIAAWVAVVAVPAGASSLTVQGGTTHTGNWAAQVDVASECGLEERAIANGTDYSGTTEEEACVSLTAEDVDVLSGADVSFRAGERIALGHGFSVASGASFRAVVGPEVAGAAFVESAHPVSESEYWARFYVFPNQLDLTSGGSLLHFTASGPDRALEMAVGLTHHVGLGENRVFVQAVEDSGGVVSTAGSEELVLPDGWHFVEVRWRASSGADDGVVEVCVDDSPGGGSMCADLLGLDNDTGRIESVRWGAMEVPQGNLGTLYMDDFRALENGPVGGCSTEQECP